MSKLKDRPRGAELAALIEQAPQLLFIANVNTGMVHVILPDSPAWARTDTARLTDLPEAEQDAMLLNFMLGVTWTLCGFVAREHRNGFCEGDHPITVFADERLCRSCVHILGDQSNRAFEHPQTEREDRDPLTQPEDE